MKSQRPQGGRIINNGSISAQVPRPHSTPYSVSKHGVAGLTKSLALEGRGFGIACGQIDIGNARTALTEAIGFGAWQADGEIRAEPTFDAQYVADAIVFMAKLPNAVSIPHMTMIATGMPYAGRG